VPYGNGKARTVAWNLPDPIPVHRETICTPRVELVAKYPTLPDVKQFRLPNIGFSVQKAALDKGIARQFPVILSSGRLAQKQTIYQSVVSEKGQTAPAGFQAKLGEKAPPSLSMRQPPSGVTSQVSAAKEYESAKLQNNEVLLINPKDRQVAQIIMPPSTTGSAK
jgi:hypothetical protein